MRTAAAFVAGAVVIAAYLALPVVAWRGLRGRRALSELRAVPVEVRSMMGVAGLLLVAGLALLAAPVTAHGPDRRVSCGPAVLTLAGASGPPASLPSGIPQFSPLEERLVRERSACSDIAGPRVALGAAVLAVALAVSLASWLRAARTIVMVTREAESAGPSTS